MTVRGHILNGTVVLDEPVKLPDGTSVEVDVRALAAGDEAPTLYERLADVIGIAPALPTDMAENHDHYIHGTPKGIDRR